MYYQEHKGTEYDPPTYTILDNPTGVVLHLYGNPEFTKKFGKKVKKAGGRYSKCRGWRSGRRFVHMPLKSDEDRELVNKIYSTYGDGTIIATAGVPDHTEAWMTVMSVPRKSSDPVATFLAEYWKAIRSAIEHKMCDLHEGDELPTHDPVPYAKKRLERAKERVQRAKQALADAESARKQARVELAGLLTASSGS